MVNLNRFLCVAELVMLDKLRGDELIEMEEDPSITMHDAVDEAVFEWDISCISSENLSDPGMESKVFAAFGMKWRMQLSDRKVAVNEQESADHVNVALYLLEENMGSKLLSIRCSFSVPALSVRYFTTMLFDAEHKDGDGGTGRVLVEDLNDTESCTLRLVMELVDVYDDGVCVVVNK